jgi:hypothetical protein
MSSTFADDDGDDDCHDHEISRLAWSLAQRERGI